MIFSTVSIFFTGETCCNRSQSFCTVSHGRFGSFYRDVSRGREIYVLPLPAID